MAFESQKDIDLFQKRMAELARKAYERNCYVYTDFLGLAEQSVLHEMERDLQYAGVTMCGSCMEKQTVCQTTEESFVSEHIAVTRNIDDFTERKMARFGVAEQCGYEEPFPIIALSIEPLQKKFSQELTHRDFLGMLMNLGIERSTIGDIFVSDNEAILFCQESIADFVMQEVTMVRHTSVSCKVAKPEKVKGIAQVKPEEQVLQVNSERIDACIAKLYNISRNDSLDLFRQGRVYVNGKICENNSYMLKEQDAVTARGFGKFIFCGVTGETRKKKMCVTVAVFRTR